MHKSYVPYIKIFMVETICMIIELCSSYLSYPYFGNSHVVWVAIIAVVLLSNGIGNLIGGKLSNKSKETGKDFTGLIFALAALSISITLLASDYLLPLVRELIPNSSLGALFSSLLLFMPCAICFGTIGPQIMYKASQDENFSGNKTGLIYAMSTIGGLTGTLIGGFILVPLFGCRTILSICVCLTIMLSLISSNPLKNQASFSTIVTTIVCVIISICLNINLTSWENQPYGSAQFDSQYNRITIQNTIIDGKPARTMSMASGFESGTYLDDNRNELIFEYMKKLDELIYGNSDIDSSNTLMVGGAAYQFPKYLVTHYDDKSVTSVEIDPEVTKLAKRYFFIDDIESTYGDRFRLVNDDGRVFIAQSQTQYDVIFNDVFAGLSPVSTMTTVEFVSQVKQTLNDDGIYVINIVDGKDESDRRLLLAEAHTVSYVFKHVYVYPIVEDNNANTQILNYLLIATDKDDLFNNNLQIDFSDGLILTDDYCPIDSLVSPNLY